MEIIDISSPTFEVSARDYRINIPFPLEEDIIDEKIKLFLSEPEKVKSPIPDLELVNIRKIQKDNEVGIMFVCISLKKIILDKKLSENDKFFIKLKDKEGNIEDKCLLTEDKIPYWFYYNGGEKLNVIE
tara:strand:- start:733 stop:1119 length:387 start_codon:yes stop_codon:yes gene_type:complete